MQLTPAQLAYAAGIFDGEGCLRANVNKQGYPVIRISVTNTDFRLVDLLKEWFGGYIWREDKSYIPNARPRYIWEVSAQQALSVINLVLPYLVLKYEQAELLIAIQAARHSRKSKNIIREEHNKLIVELSARNRKGIA